MLKEQKLTEKELRGYRQWLSELDVESREEQESSRQTVDPDIWRVFNPEGNIGRQIYESYTDEALLEAVVGTMDHPGALEVPIKRAGQPKDFEKGWKSKSGGRQTGRSGCPQTDSGRIANGLVLP